MFTTTNLMALAAIGALSPVSAESNHYSLKSMINDVFSSRKLQSVEDDSDVEFEDYLDQVSGVLDTLGYNGDMDDILISDEDFDLWYEEHLEKQADWAEENKHLDRWSDRNKEKGWDYDDVQDEFSDFFDEYDISTMTADDFNDLELEFERTIAMLNRGEKSGKMRKASCKGDCPPDCRACRISWRI